MTDVYQPCPRWTDGVIASILSRVKSKGISEGDIVRGEIYCGGSVHAGAVILKDGTKVEV